ncbi:hypothetical protein LSTR_LSTR016401 [Laodelphax striatellus]|uniref:Uncharacterized protein n=1 Tax=Laodelphax striatellus TaxID=195883 RepID=A0A482WWU0_LAOST|nr:hypothetical protein LSTR_LSTR016401 [Laodelphax striatellus]
MLKKENKKLHDENATLRRKVETLRKRIQRSKSPIEVTPRKKVKHMLKGQNCSNEIKKQLVFGEVLKNQINVNFKEEKSLNRKRCLATFLSGKIIKKYRMMSKVRDIISRRTTNLITNNKHIHKLVCERKDVTYFLSQDEHSKQCAGKKETITRKKVKMQKRLLTDSLQNLHKKFTATYQNHNDMSYSKFCKLRPFWITIPDCKNRDTCLCKLHTNMELIVSKLNSSQLITEKNTKDLLSSLTCDGETNEICLQRKCVICKLRNIDIALNDDNKNDTINYFYWNTIEVEVEIKGIKKKKKKTVKEDRSTTKEMLVRLFRGLLNKFLIHVLNIKHQYRAIRQAKENLKVNEGLLHMDYSENYNCKYTEEIQSLHFGGSRNQATLHTSILYYKDKVTEDLKSVCFCTVSEERRHDAVAVCGHLKPIFKEIKNLIPNLSKMHFVSDGPSSQYRNRKMFVLIGEYLTSLLGVSSVNWHYLEAGHGKGAADGVGGVLKRTADNLVSKGVDIPTVPVLVQQLNLHCPGVKVIYVTHEEVLEWDNLQLTLPKFKGTIKTHEICWAEANKNLIQVRSLTCMLCAPNQKCKHFHIGQINLQHSQGQNTKTSTASSSTHCGKTKTSMDKLKNRNNSSFKTSTATHCILYTTKLSILLFFYRVCLTIVTKIVYQGFKTGFLKLYGYKIGLVFYS